MISALARTRRSRIILTGAAMVGAFAVAGVFAPFIAPYDPHAITGAALLHPSLHHFLGTNDVGQDIFSQLVYGARSSLAVAIGASCLATFCGVIVGVWAGLRGGVADIVAMRVVDVALAMPALPLLILLAALAGPSPLVVVIAIGSLGWPAIARLVRSQTLSLRGRGYVVAARGFGAGPGYLIRRHLGPALGPLIASQFVDLVGIAIALEAGLAFLGLADSSSVSWGATLNRALAHPGIYDTAAWTWWVLPPGLAITVAVLGFAFVGVGLEPRFAPERDRF